MKLAFCLFKYFPYGGLQRDLYAAVEIALARGHCVDIYTMSWQGEAPTGANIHLVPVRGLTNHARARLFSVTVGKMLNQKYYDRVVGFNKIQGLDIYFTGENCFAQHLKSKKLPFIRFFPRYFIFSLLEKKVFSPKSQTEILLIAPQEQEVYQKFYHTQSQRFHFLLPGIKPRKFSDTEVVAIRNTWRDKHAILAEKIWVLFVASDYALKGLLRILTVIAAFDNDLHKKIVVSVIGQDESGVYQSFLQKKGIKTRVDFLGASNEVYELMSSADLLVHPAKLELAGKVLLEAVVNHLPILTTAVCGCASYVAQSGGGLVLAEPYTQGSFNQAFLDCLRPDNLQAFRKKLVDYQLDHRAYYSHQQLVDYVEKISVKLERDFFLDDYLSQRLSCDKKTCLNAIFSLQGEVYRQVKSRKTIFIHWHGKDYFIKMHHGVGWREILKNSLVFKSAALGAKQEYQAIRAMEKAGILVPEVCAYATEGANPAKIRSFVMTKRIHYQEDLEKFCQAWQKTPPTAAFRRRLIQRVAEIARNMHAAGMNHRDFYLCHFLLNKRGDNDFDLYLIDLHRVQIRQSVPLRWKIKDLSSLYFSAMGMGLTRRDGFYFLRWYYQLPIGTILRKKWLLWWWIRLRAKRLYHRHQKKRGI